jgi:hypothetical protein
LEEDEGWKEVLRTPSPRNPGQKKSPVWVKRRQKGNELYVLCRNDREERIGLSARSSEERLRKDLQALQASIEKGHLQATEKIHEAIGRLKERRS